MSEPFKVAVFVGSLRRGSITRMADYFQTVLKCVASVPDARIRDIAEVRKVQLAALLEAVR